MLTIYMRHVCVCVKYLKESYNVTIICKYYNNIIYM